MIHQKIEFDLLDSENLDITDQQKRIFMSGTGQIFEYAYTKKNPDLIKRDSLSILLGYEGFLDFIDKYHLEKDIRISSENQHMISDEQHPLNIDVLNDFFSNKCWLYTYNEKLGNEQRTKYRDTFFPSINAYILTNIGNNTFNLSTRNIDHGNAILKYTNEEKQNSIELYFPYSKYNLSFRFPVPNKTEDYISKPDVLIGQFIYTKIKNGVSVTGSAVLKNIEVIDKELKSFSFVGSIRPKDVDVNRHIIDFLFNRYHNFHKTPRKFTFSKLQDWIVDKRDINYTKRLPVIYDYLVTFPITSPKGGSIFLKDHKKTFEDIIYNFKDNGIATENVRKRYFGRSKQPVKDIPQIIKSINLNLLKNKIHIFPEEFDRYKSYGREELNKTLLQFISKSISIIIILPDVEYSVVSSVYIIMGYAIALRRKLFIFHQGNRLPYLLDENIRNMAIRIIKYEKIEEIPFHLYFLNKSNLDFKQREGEF